MVTKRILKDRAEWLRNRMNGIGGSEISAVVGLNPYMDNVELWMIKTGRKIPEDISQKPYVKYGTEAEDHLRELFRMDFPEYEVFYEENNSFVNDRYPWAQASLDGWLIDENGRLGILEIKTTEILASMQREKWVDDNIPMNYYCQVLFYMAVMEADFVELKAQLKTEFDGRPYLQTKHYYIERTDVEDDIQWLMEEGEKFWRLVQEDRKPALVLPEI